MDVKQIKFPVIVTRLEETSRELVPFNERWMPIFSFKPTDGGLRYAEWLAKVKPVKLVEEALKQDKQAPEGFEYGIHPFACECRQERRG